MVLLSRDFSEFLACLNQHQVRYLRIGGYTVGLYGYPRYTKDLEIWIEALRENAEKVVKAIERYWIPACTDRFIGQTLGRGVRGWYWDPLIRLENLRKNKRASGRS